MTRHGGKRLKERAGFNKRAAARMASRALTDGLPREQARGALREFMDVLWSARHNSENMRVYGEFVYLFSGETLVTVLPLPQSIRVLIRRAS